MRIGFAVPQSGAWATPEAMRAVATRAERLGYHELWTFQRLLYPVGHPMGPVYRSVHDPLITLSFLAGITGRIRLGVAVVNAFVQPVVLAKQLATLQTVSGGRLTAGLGLGWVAEEFEATGVDAGRRGARGEEFVEVLRTMWADEVVEHRGEFYRIPPSYAEPKPSPAPPPILLGGTADVALRRAGRIADGWVSASREDLTGIAARIALVKQAAEEAGRDPASLRFVCRGVTRVRREPGERRPLTGTVEQIKEDVSWLAEQGVTDLFHDLNFDPAVVTADPAGALRQAEEVLEALAPAG